MLRNKFRRKALRQKKLRADKDGLNVINIFRQKQISEQIEVLRTDVAKLKTEKAVLLSDMKCENEKDVQNIKKQREQNDISLKNISTRNVQLDEQMKTDVSDFKATVAEISPRRFARRPRGAEQFPRYDEIAMDENSRKVRLSQ